jgi:hypothetical protein
MTAQQIRKALEKAGIDMNTITDIGRDTFEVYVPAEGGKYADEKKTAKAERAARKVFPWGGYKTGYGAVVFIDGHKTSQYSGKGQADPMHY